MEEVKTYGLTESALIGRPTLFKGISCHGAKFDNIRNTTGAKLPSEKDLREVLSGDGGIVSSLFSVFKKSN